MKIKSQLSDYEPVRRSNATKTEPSKLEIEDSFARTSSNSDSSVESVQASVKAGAPDSMPEPLIRRASKSSSHSPAGTGWPNKLYPTEEPASRYAFGATPWATGLRENWIRSHGHSLSFAGLFLFTFDVYFRPYEWSPALFWLSSSAFWIAALTLAIFIPTQLGLENNLTARPREVKLILLLALMALLSVPFALEPLRAWNGFVEYLKVVAMFIVMVNVVTTKKRLQALIWLVLIASVVLSAAAMNDYQTGRLGLNGYRIEGVIGGLFDNPNDLALHLVTIVPIAIAVGFASRNVMNKLIYMGMSLLFVCGIVATFSRGGFLGLICAVTVLGWKLARKNRMLFVVGGATVLLAAIIFPTGAYRDRLSTTNDESALARTDDLKRSLFLAIRHPLAGVGMDNYILYSNVGKVTHNAYTQVAAELGLAAAIFYIGFIIVSLKSLRKIELSRENEDRRSYSSYLAIGLQASLIGFMVSSFFASVAYQWYVYYLVAYSICLRRLALVEDDLKLGAAPKVRNEDGNQ